MGDDSDTPSRLERAIENASDEQLTALAKEIAQHPRFRRVLKAKLRLHQDERDNFDNVKDAC